MKIKDQGECAAKERVVVGFSNPLMNIVLNFDRYRVCGSYVSMQNNVWDQKNAEKRIRKPIYNILKLQPTIPGKA